MCRTPEYGAILVALLAEGVDRNIKPLMKLDPQRVALLAEGVDRNVPNRLYKYREVRSPSSRRAWIEMSLPGGSTRTIFSRPPRGGRGYTLSLS